jgi:hypothetical protein
MEPAEIQEHCTLDSPARQLLDTAFERLALTAAALHRVFRVALSLADLAGAERLSAAHVAEAVQYRGRKVAGPMPEPAGRCCGRRSPYRERLLPVHQIFSPSTSRRRASRS